MMSLEPHGPDTFVGSGPRYPWGGLYGGQIVAQALRAAAHTVDAAFRLHSLHAYFIRLGDADEPIRLEVDRIRNGRSFVTRRVVARQAVGAILNLSASFHIPELAVDVQTETAPRVAAPDDLPVNSWSPLMDRRVLPADIAPGRVGAWMRMKEELGDPILHACALAFLSDDLPTDAVIAMHPDRPPRDGQDQVFWNASLDHTMWFHHPLDASRWHLHDFRCLGIAHSHGISLGAIFDAEGRKAATVVQEVLLRPRRHS